MLMTLATTPLGDLSGSIHGWSGRYSALDNVMSFLAQDVIYLALLAFVVLWFRRDGLRAGLAAGAGAVLALMIAGIIGAIHYSARPFVAGHYAPLFSHSDDASFPSDHLAILGAVTAGAWMGSRLLGVAAGLLAVIVAFARVFAGVHYVTDVGVGF